MAAVSRSETNGRRFDLMPVAATMHTVHTVGVATLRSAIARDRRLFCPPDSPLKNTFPHFVCWHPSRPSWTIRDSTFARLSSEVPATEKSAANSSASLHVRNGHRWSCAEGEGCGEIGGSRSVQASERRCGSMVVCDRPKGESSSSLATEIIISRNNRHHRQIRECMRNDIISPSSEDGACPLAFSRHF